MCVYIYMHECIDIYATGQRNLHIHTNTQINAEAKPDSDEDDEQGPRGPTDPWSNLSSFFSGPPSGRKSAPPTWPWDWGSNSNTSTGSGRN